MSRLAGTAGNVFVTSQLIVDGVDAWDEQVIANVTATSDSTERKAAAAAAAKFAVAAGFTTGLIGSEAVGPLNLTTFTELLAWVKSSVNLSAADWQLLLDNTALCASPLETLDIPALTADTWKLIKIAFATPANLTAVISVGLQQSVDKGAMNFWIDEVCAAKAIAGIKSWQIDDELEALNARGFDDAGQPNPVAGAYNWRGSFEGFKDGAPIAKAGDRIYIEPQESATSTRQWRGMAVITARHAKTDAEGLVTYSYDFVGRGELVEPTA